MATQIEKKTAELMLKKLRAKIDGIFKVVQAEKAEAEAKGKSQMAPLKQKYGGMIPKFGGGGTTGSYTRYDMDNPSPWDNIDWTSTDNEVINDNPGGPMSFKDANNYGKSGNGWNTAANIGMTLGSMAPIAYNLIQGSRKEQVLNPKDFYNPYENDVRSIMRNRRFNVNPLLERNKNSQAVFNRNVGNISSSRGELLSNYGAGNVGRMRMDAEAGVTKQNMDLGYMGEQAQTDMILGQTRAGTKLNVQNMNDQNSAARRNYLASAAGQLSQGLQAQQLMRNQRLGDQDRLGIIKNSDQFAESWFQDMFNKYYKKQG